MPALRAGNIYHQYVPLEVLRAMMCLGAVCPLSKLIGITNHAKPAVQRRQRCGRQPQNRNLSVMNRTINTISQRAAREGLGTPEMFQGGVYVTKNGNAELFIQTAEDRALELETLQNERENKALLRLVMLAQQDISDGRTFSVEEAKERMRHATT